MKNNKYELMRRIICGLFIWNLILTFGLTLQVVNTDKTSLSFTPTPTSNPTINEQICELELIPEGLIQ